MIYSQVRIAEGDNTAQYWPNLGNQQSAIVIGPVSPFASVKYWADEGGFCRMFKFSDLQPKHGPVSALLLLLLWHPVPKVEKPESGPWTGHYWAMFGAALARCCAENKCWRLEFGPKLASKWIPELSFHQRHDIGNRSSATFLPMLGHCWAVSISHLNLFKNFFPEIFLYVKNMSGLKKH